MATTLTIGGSSVSLTAYQLGTLVAYSRGSYATLSLYQRGGVLPTTYTFVGHEAILSIAGTVRFKGDVISAHPEYHPQLGWVVAYRAVGLRWRGDRFPHTDSATGIYTSLYNMSYEDPLYDGTRAGRTIGQILADVITMSANGAALTSKGIGHLTLSGGVYSLPSTTTSDLAALTTIPPAPVQFGGEKFLTAVESFLAEWAPNHMLWVDPTNGDIRVLSTLSFTPSTLTMGTDPIEPTELSRDVTDCFQRVVVQGQPIAIMALLKTSNGTLTEDFAHDGLTNSAAKAAWTAADWQNPGTALDSGTVTCSSTTSIVYTSSGTATYGSNVLDQSHLQATITLSSTTVTNYTQFWSARVVANTAFSSNSGTLTIDNPLPHLSFDHATLTMTAQSKSVVWTQYLVANTNLWPRVTRQSTYPAPLINGSLGVSFISSPMGLIKRSDGVTAPAPFTWNAATGHVRFFAPTYITANNTTPADVWVMLPVYTNPLQAIEPPDSGGPVYSGTSHTVDGLSDTLTVTVESWRDPAQLSQVQAYATDLLNSVQDAVVEGSVTYYGLYSAALVPGVALDVAGDGYTTGWETIALPVIECTVEWPIAGPMQHVTTMRCTNRRAHLSAAAWMKPARAFLPLGFGMDADRIFSPGAPMLPGPMPEDMADLGGGFASFAPGDLGTMGPTPPEAPVAPAGYPESNGTPEYAPSEGLG